MTLGAYSFLPWLRRGVANEITNPDGDAGVILRPQVTVGVSVVSDNPGGGTTTTPAGQTVALYGPGDILAIDPRTVVRTEPRTWVTNFEPNYLAAIDFYDEDFPWRYTPAAPDLAKRRLRPWITLVVLTEKEFTDSGTPAGQPLPSIVLTDPAVLPPADELWAWAHVHVNQSLAGSDTEFVSTDSAAVTGRLSAVLAQNADLAYARLLCPRRLEPDTAYHAFVIPTFEAGRRAGLALDTSGVVATMSAWDPGDRPSPASFPYYYRWYFHTGGNGDFEALVRLLTPKPVDPRVGTRDVDVRNPGPGVRGVDNPALGGMLHLGGALRPPGAIATDVFEQWDMSLPRPLQTDLARLVNLPDDDQSSGEVDPVVAPPLYGRWHALTSRVLTDATGASLIPADTPDGAEGWVQRLNLDPRWRSAAGLGTRAVDVDQEKYMAAAWSQVGAILAAVQRVRLGQLSMRVSEVWHDRHLRVAAAAGPQRLLSLVAPVSARIRSGGVTVRQTLAVTPAATSLTSPAARRVTRARGRLARSLPVDSTRPLSGLLARVNAGEVLAAPARRVPVGAMTADAVADHVLVAAGLPVPPGADATTHLPFPAGNATTRESLPAEDVTTRLPLPSPGAAPLDDQMTQPMTEARPVAREPIPSGPIPSGPIPTGPTFPGGAAGKVLATASSIRDGIASVEFTGGLAHPADAEAARFAQALRDSLAVHKGAETAGAPPTPVTLDLAQLSTDALTALDPTRTVVNRIRGRISLPPQVTSEVGDGGLVEPMAYPVIDQPMYEPLQALGTDLFLPGANFIGDNTVTLLQTNRRFIESYMAGVNHEFASELLWREYPTDQRGTPFRQFWDARGAYNTAGLPDEAFRESLRDIPPLHQWAPDTALGTHGTGGADQLVLLIRGELLKRYPNAIVYAHRAQWQTKPDGTPDTSLQREFVPLTDAEELAPPPAKLLIPRYDARIDPDIYLFGFDLTPAVARGGSGNLPTDDPGWFFVIKERPGEPRFGLDADPVPVIEVWNDLAWPNLTSAPPGGNLTIGGSPAAVPLTAPTGEAADKLAQYQEDLNIVWSHDVDAAALAYVLFQAPVLVGVHASEMLTR